MERLAAIEQLAQAICEVRGVDVAERPDYRYLAQRLIDQGWKSPAKCFECSGTDCALVGDTYAFCDETCRSSFMASLT